MSENPKQLEAYGGAPPFTAPPPPSAPPYPGGAPGAPVPLQPTGQGQMYPQQQQPYPGYPPNYGGPPPQPPPSYPPGVGQQPMQPQGAHGAPPPPSYGSMYPGGGHTQPNVDQLADNFRELQVTMSYNLTKALSKKCLLLNLVYLSCRNELLVLCEKHQLIHVFDPETLYKLYDFGDDVLRCKKIDMTASDTQIYAFVYEDIFLFTPRPDMRSVRNKTAYAAQKTNLRFTENAKFNSSPIPGWSRILVYDEHQDRDTYVFMTVDNAQIQTYTYLRNPSELVDATFNPRSNMLIALFEKELIMSDLQGNIMRRTAKHFNLESEILLDVYTNILIEDGCSYFKLDNQWQISELFVNDPDADPKKEQVVDTFTTDTRGMLYAIGPSRKRGKSKEEFILHKMKYI